MTAPGVGPITALAVASAFDDPARFKRSSSAGAYLGLTPRRYESGEVSYNGRSSKRGDRMTRTYLYEAANSVITRNRKGSALREWAIGIATRTGPSKARVALARKLAVILHAMWRTGSAYEERAAVCRCSRTNDSADHRQHQMRPAGTCGEDEIASHAAATKDRAHHFVPSNPNANVRRPSRRPRREPWGPAAHR